MSIVYYRAEKKRDMSENTVFNTLIDPLRRAVADAGYQQPTPIQAEAIPPVLKGKDLLGCAQTGTGKTAAFTLPLLQRMTERPAPTRKRQPRTLILAPTRELVAQIGEQLETYGKHLALRHITIYGGVSQNPQVKAMQRGVDIVVATPGRLMDLIQQGFVRLDRLEFFVLDEADRMLDMGFMPDIRRIVAQLPKERQSLFFSATMPPPIEALTKELLYKPARVAIDPEQPTVDRIAQSCMFVDREDKDALLLELISAEAMDKVLIFTRTKHGADRVVRKLSSSGIAAAAIHGNKSQAARTSALYDFRRGRVRALIATDLASRGLDVDGITHVINYDLPEDAETYIHRIGRTARAGSIGDAVSFCSARERDQLRAIAKMLRQDVPVNLEHTFHSDSAEKATGAEARPLPRGNQPMRRPSASRGPRRAGGNQRRSSQSSRRRRARHAAA